MKMRNYFILCLFSWQILPVLGQISPQKAVIPSIVIDQNDLDDPTNTDGTFDLNRHKIPFKRVFEAGRHLFTTPFTKLDGAGEGLRTNDETGMITGALGLREEDYNNRIARIYLSLHPEVSPNDLRSYINSHQNQYNAFAESLAPATAILSNGIPVLDSKNNSAVRFDFLRVNGLDSQSCFECHNSIGSDPLPGQSLTNALTRKVSVTGGPAGFASDAFIGGSQVTFPTNGDSEIFPFTEFLRNPPHVFGTGYAIKLAEEMSLDLMASKSWADMQARENVSHFGYVDLTSKGTTFGSYSVTNINGQLVGNYSNIVGVSTDLVVRPLQWKGIASDERNFVRSALEFHFGMFPNELCPGYPMVTNADPDSDGVTNEVTEGEVTALAVFTMMIRPPTMEPTTPENHDIVMRGEALFEGRAKDIPFSESCASCHTPHLSIANSETFVRDPRFDPPDTIKNVTGLVAQNSSSVMLPVVKEFADIMKAQLNELKTESISKMTEMNFLSSFHSFYDKFKNRNTAGYHFDLSLKNTNDLFFEQSFSISYPRLPENVDGSIDVPLFSDLKRHKMGSGLADRYDQGTDVAGINVKADEFLTRPLWGVADTGPWLHDGRARTLREAILMHDSPGSEASPAIHQFLSLSTEDQNAIIEFLLRLRLPVDLRYSADSPMLPSGMGANGYRN